MGSSSWLPRRFAASVAWCWTPTESVLPTSSVAATTSQVRCGPSARPSVRRVVKVEKKEGGGFGVIALRDGCAWHLSKMDSTTWGIFLLTALFLASVVLTPRTQ